MFKWIRTPLVKAALNVRYDSNFFSGDNGDGFTYVQTEEDLTGFYKDLVTPGWNNDTNSTQPGDHLPRVLIIQGDTDSSILNPLTSQSWTENLGFNETEGWRPWTTDG